MSKLLYSLLFLFFSQVLFSQDITVRGFIYDKSNGEAMAYEKVKLLSTDSTVIAGAVSDINGFYSIPKLILGILTAPQLGFFRLWKTNIHRIHAVSAISPITFDFGGGYYRTSPDISIKCKIKPRKHSIFAGIYRKWCNQFVRKIIEKRQRGPPSKNLLSKYANALYIL